MSNHPGKFATTGYNPAADNIDLPEPVDMEPAAERLAARRLQGTPAAVVAAGTMQVDEYTRFEQQASKAFPDLAITVGITSQRDLVKGWQSRRYLLRARGQAIGSTRLEVVSDSIAEAITGMIAQVARARRAATEAREAAARTRSRQAA